MQAKRIAYPLRKPYNLQMTHNAAVLTGDLIASTQAGQAAVDGAMAVIEAIATHEAQISGQDIRFARFRGDGWQIYCPDPTRVFRLTVLVLANLHSRPALAQTRLAVAIGAVDALPSTGLASASGEAFIWSGHKLDGMTKKRLIGYGPKADGYWQKPLFNYLEWQSSRWSPEQAEAVALAFHDDPPLKSNVARHLAISRQAAEARLYGAGFLPLCDADRAFHGSQRGNP